MYEWVIGFGKEINLFWREKITAATVLFLLNRYAPLLYFLSSFSGSTATTDKVSRSTCSMQILGLELETEVFILLLYLSN